MLDGHQRATNLPSFLFHPIKGTDPAKLPLVCIDPMSGLTGAWNKFVEKFGQERDVAGAACRAKRWVLEFASDLAWNL